MVDHAQGPDEDLEPLWESLWGPREQTIERTVDVVWGRRATGAEPSRQTTLAPQGGAPQHNGSRSIDRADPCPAERPGLDREHLRSYLDTLTQQMAAVRSELASAVAELQVTRADQVDDQRRDLAGMEWEVSERLAALEERAQPELRRLADAAAAGTSRLTAVEHEVRAELDRLGEAVRALDRRSLSAEELNALRPQVDAAVAEQVAGLLDGAVAAADARVAGAETRLLARLERVPERLAQAEHAAAAGRQALDRLEAVDRDFTERLTAVEERLGHELRRLADVVEAQQSQFATAADLDALRAAVEARLEAVTAAPRDPVTQNDLVALRDQVGELRDQLGPVQERANDEGAMGAAVRDLSRRVDRIAGELTEARSKRSDESDVDAEVVALRSELDEAQREIRLLHAAVTGATEQLDDRLDEMAAWVVSEATRKAKAASADASASAPAVSDMLALKEQVLQLTGVVAELQNSRRKSRRK